MSTFGAADATRRDPSRQNWILERETGVEPATSTLARSRSTTELLPLDNGIINDAVEPAKFAGEAPASHAQCPVCHCGSLSGATISPSRM